MNYDLLYQRREGLFTSEENQKIKESKFFIAGVGGTGGVQAVALARIGVSEITIMDPGVYDEPDINRQHGAMISTLGKNKAEVMGNILRDIAPFTKINVIKKILSEKDLREEIKKVTKIVINSIDFADFKYKTMFSDIAKEEGKYSMGSPIPDFETVLMIFSPEGMSFSEFTKGERFPPITPVAIKNYEQDPDNQKNKIPFLASKYTCSTAAMLSAAVLVNEAIMIITGRRKKEDIIVVPNITYVDLFNRFFKVFNPLLKK